VNESDFVYFSGYALLHESNARALMAFLQRIPAATCLVFDPGPIVSDIREELLAAVFERVDWFSCNAREATLLTGRSDLDEAALALRGRLTRGSVVVRIGAAGCVVADSANLSTVVPGFKVVSVDSNGAGDCHVGAFCALLAIGREPLEAVRWANAAAALSVTKGGPATGPTLAELEEFLR
jgi:sugar/nucleoside kinase (ribokinase family)